MKKTILALAALGTLLFPSCSNDEMVINSSGTTDGTVTFTLAPEAALSRAYSDGLTATKLHYAAYEAGTKNIVYTSKVADDPQATSEAGRQFSLQLNLIKGESYDFVFWADKGDGSPYTFNPSDQTISVSYDGVTGNDEGRDAFFQTIKNLQVTGQMQQSVVLHRPFAQVNIGTSDLQDAQKLNTTIASTIFKVSGMHNQLDLFTGIASGSADVTFTATGLPQGEIFPNVKEGVSYDYVAMNYVLTGVELENADDVQKAKSELMNAELELKYKDNKSQKIKIDNMPVQRNYRTNIYGALITTPLDFTITVDQEYNTPDQNYSELLFAAQNGGEVTLNETVELKEPLVIADGKTVTINLNGHDIINTTQNSNKETYVLVANGHSTLNIEGEGNIKAIADDTEDDGYRMAVYAYGDAVVNIKGGNFYNSQKTNAQLDLIYANGNAVINISGGTFESNCFSNRNGKIVYWVLNKKNDSNAKINVTGGTFINFNPASPQTDDDETYVAEGYQSVLASSSDQDKTYKVVKSVSSASDINDAISKALQTESKTIYTDKPLSFPENVSIDGQGVTIEGAPVYFNGNATVKNIVFANGKNANGKGSAVYVEPGASKNITFEGCTFTNAEWDAIQLTNPDIQSVTIKDCVFKNTRKGYRYIHIELLKNSNYVVNKTAKLTITGCTFENITQDYCKDSAVTIGGLSFSNMIIENNVIKGAAPDQINSNVFWICDGWDFNKMMSDEAIAKAFMKQ